MIYNIAMERMGNNEAHSVIPLTPEILEKCAFKLQPQRTSIFVKDRLKLWIGNNNGAIAYLKNENTDECYYIPKNCQFLHHLKNMRKVNQNKI